MQAITTKYLPATNTKGSRIKATCSSGLSITIETPNNKSEVQSHLYAAVKLAEKLQWTGTLIQGAIEGGYAHVFSCGESAEVLPEKQKIQIQVYGEDGASIYEAQDLKGKKIASLYIGADDWRYNKNGSLSRLVEWENKLKSTYEVIK